MQRCLGLVALGAWLLFHVLSPPPANAQGAGPDTIGQIRIEGNQRIETETVRSYVGVAPGDSFDPEALDRALKSLYATGLFSDVTFRREGSTLVIDVVENPIINRIAFEGNSKISEEDLRSEVQLRPRTVFTRTKVQSDVKRILELYRRSGRFAASVEPKIIRLPQNRVDLVFEIREGPLTEIKRINFVGNRRFSDDRLRSVIQTKETRWYRFLTTDDTYDPDRLSFDRELLRRFYLANGYADFRVVSAVAELTSDREGFFVTFTVEEGKRYRFGEVNIRTELKALDPEKLREQLTTIEGDWYDAEEVENSIENVTATAGRQGFAFVEIRPVLRRNREERTVDLIYDIREGPRVFVERINITGNTRTLDKVVRREFRLAEGDAFNTAKIRRSLQRIRNLGFFSNVSITNEPGSKPDRTVINVEVEEQPTGELSVGAGFSSSQGVLGDIGIRERNLLGRGQDLRLGLRTSQRTQEIDLSFTEPYFLERNISAGFDVFRTIFDQQDESSFDQESLGFALRGGYRITEFWEQNFKYTLRTDDISDVDANASRFIRDQIGSRTTSAIGQTLTFDKRDNKFDPTDGFFVQLSNDVAGLGGNVRYLRTVVTGGIFHSFADNWVGTLTGRASVIFGLDDDVRITDRFFLGGDNFRGFDTAGIGPRDVSTNDSLGGNQVYKGTAEVSFPLGLPEELGISGSLFTDFGTLTEIDDSGANLVDTGSIRASVGVGLGWRSPFGPVRIDFGVPVVKEDFDETENVRFSFGTRF